MALIQFVSTGAQRGLAGLRDSSLVFLFTAGRLQMINLPVVPNDHSSTPRRGHLGNRKTERRWRNRQRQTSDCRHSPFSSTLGRHLQWSPEPHSRTSEPRKPRLTSPDVLDKLQIALHPQARHHATYSQDGSTSLIFESTPVLYCLVKGRITLLASCRNSRGGSERLW